MSESEPKRRAFGFLSSRRFAGQVARVAGGTAAGQLAVILASPLLSRLFTKSEFGLFASYLAILMLAAPASSLRFPLAIVIPEDRDVAHDLVRLSLVVPTFAFVVLELLGFALGDSLVERLGAPQLEPYLWLIPVAALATAYQEGLSLWAIRNERFGRVATSKGASAASKAVAQVGLGLVATLGSLGLMVGDLVGRVGAVLLLAQGSGLRLRAASSSSLLSLASKYREFGLFAGPAAVVNSAGAQIAPLLFIAYFGLEVGGLFALGQRVIALPLAVLGQAVAQVYVGAAGRLAREDPFALRRLYWKTTVRLLMIGAVPVVALAAAGPFAFELVFGPGWGESGVYVRILAVMYLVQFVVSPLSQTLNVLGRNRWQLGWDIGRLVAIVAAVGGVGMGGLPARVGMAAFGVAMTLAYATMILLNGIALRRLRPAVAGDADEPGGVANPGAVEEA